jgi:hypothetical protein
VHRRNVILSLISAIVFLLSIIIILLMPLMRIGVHIIANVGGRYTSLNMLYVKPGLSVTLLVNLKAYIAGGVIETSKNV